MYLLIWTRWRICHDLNALPQKEKKSRWRFHNSHFYRDNIFSDYKRDMNCHGLIKYLSDNVLLQLIFWRRAITSFNYKTFGIEAIIYI